MGKRCANGPSFSSRLDRTFFERRLDRGGADASSTLRSRVRTFQTQERVS